LGNVFLEGEPVSVRVNSKDEASWVLRDLTGRVVARGTFDGRGDAGGGVLTLPFPRGERGHYTLALQEREGRKGWRTSLAVLEPFDLSGVARSPFGVCTHFGQLRGDNTDLLAPSRVSPDVVPLMGRAGFKTHRDELPWNRLEPLKGRYTLPEAHRAYLGSCGAHHVGSLIILDYGNRHYDNAAAPHTDEGLDGFANYAREVVRRCGPQLHAVEVWNEYNGSFSKGPMAKRPEGYFELLKRTYRAVKAERPDLSVVGPAAVTLPYGWLERLFRLGALDYLDAVSVHPYMHPAAPDTVRGDLSTNLGRLHDLIRRYNGGKPKPVLLTEIGWPTHRAGVSVRAAARYAVRGFVMALATGIGEIYWYELVNGGTDPGKREHNFGLLRHRDDPLGAYVPKPAYVALTVLTRQLTGARFREKDPTPDPVYSYRFQKGGQDLRVMWAPRRAQRPPGPLETTVYAQGPLLLTDMVGRTRRLEPERGEIKLGLSPSPIYLQGEVRGVAAHPEGWLGRVRRLLG